MARDHWSADQVRVHLTGLIDAERRATAQRFADTRIAVETAREAADRRLDTMNEFRAQLNDQTASFLTRNESDTRHETTRALVGALADRLASLEQAERDRHAHERGGNAVWGYVIGAVGVFTGLAGVVGALLT